MSDIRTAESAFNRATETLERWSVKWQAQFFKPLAEDIARKILLSMTPEQHMAQRAQDTEGYDAVMKKLGIGGE